MYVRLAWYIKGATTNVPMPRRPSGKKPGGQPKDTEKWALSVRRSTRVTFERIAGDKARKLAAKMLDNWAKEMG